jgi:hypothetical protein
MLESDTHRIASIGILSIIEVSFDKGFLYHRSREVEVQWQPASRTHQATSFTKFEISQVQVEDFVCVCHVEVVTESRRSDDLCEVDAESVIKIGVSSNEYIDPFE